MARALLLLPRMIRLRGVEKCYDLGGGKVWVLRRIDLDVTEGEFISIMGPSGAGKSTLLHVLGMHDSAWTGEYYLLDQPVHALDKKKRAELQKRNIGFVFQSYHLLDDLTVYENLEIPLSYRDVKKSERQSIVADVLDRFQIVGKKDLYPTQLSGGQHQPGPRDHGAVQEAQPRGNHDRPGHALGGERRLRGPHRQDGGRLDRQRLSRSGGSDVGRRLCAAGRPGRSNALDRNG